MLSPKDLKDMFADSTPERVLLRAQKLAAKGRNDQALQVLKEAIDRFGEVADLRIEMASLSLSSGRPRDAAAALKALVRAGASNVPRV
ncbi:MAG TPA: tetratricopeptide repeat protein, partial [Candidatus Polarisedimenticolia bacterium]|nr:tetratricopeptide repeat protein [Candidatus Polarisedimenticolia bacterium]